MNRWNLAWLISIPMMVVLGLTFSYSAPVGREHEQDYELIRLVAEVLSVVDQKYVRELTPDQRRKFVEDMINGGLERLDPHTSFFNARDLKQFDRRNEGSYGGIGVHFTMDHANGGLFVSSPMVGSPAYEAGIQPGDLILKVNGVSLEHKLSGEISDMIMGKPGTPVTLTVLHEGESRPEDITLTRALIKVSTVLGDVRKNDDAKEWQFFVDAENKIAYVRLIEFDKPTADELKSILLRLQKEGLRGLVLDLRGNPGGLLSSAVEISDYFIKEGTIVSTRDSRGGKEKTYVAKSDNNILEPADQYPIAVLVDRNSASAAEIVAAALQDHGRAVVIGERSYGKGSIQDFRPIEDEKSAVKLTIATYFRPSGKNIHRFSDAGEKGEWGVSPNPGLEVTLTDEERKARWAGRRYRDIVPAKNGHVPEKLKDKQQGPFVDKALDRAVQHLKEKITGKASS